MKTRNVQTRDGSRLSKMAKRTEMNLQRPQRHIYIKAFSGGKKFTKEKRD